MALKSVAHGHQLPIRTDQPKQVLRAMEIGKRLRRMRKNRQMTVKELAEISGIGEKTIYRVEVGEVTDPKISTFIPLVRALDCSADELLFDKVVIDQSLTRTIKDLMQLPEDEKLPLLLVLDRYRIGCELIRDMEERGFAYRVDDDKENPLPETDQGKG